MEKTRYAVWFLSTVALVIAALAVFNGLAGAYILHHPAGGSAQTLSGFERALKPVWLEQHQPKLVLVGSSRVRDGFDPALIDPALKTRSFNYGASSMTPYEARRFVQDALAHPSVNQVVVALDAFTGNGGPGEALPSFDETRLAVTPSGDPTPRLPAYSHMTEAILQRDLNYRRARTMRMGDGAARELSTMLAAACRAHARVALFFPPDNMAIIARYRQSEGLDAFKQIVRDAVARHNAKCGNKVALFDFMAPNALTRETLRNGSSRDYVDLVHFRPPAGLWLLQQMGVTGN